MRSRSSGSARIGLGEWLIQRVSALYLGGFTLWIGARMVFVPPADYLAWKAWLSGGPVRLAFALFILAVLAHAWVGLRSVFLDYLKPLWLRALAQLLLATGLLMLIFWAAQILLIETRP